MNPENKQRIVGIVVLIAFVALMIPFLFSSGFKKKDQAAVTNDTIPVQVAETNLEQNASNDMVGKVLPDDMQTPVVTSGQPSGLPKEQVENPIPLQSSDQLLPSDVAPTQVVPTQNVVVPTPVVAEINPGAATKSGATTPVTVDKIEPEPVIVEPVTTKSSVKVKKPVPKSVVKGGIVSWSIQVGSFSSQPKMQKLVANLQAKGFRVYLQKINTSRGAMVRVLVGRETTKAKATKLAQQLKTKLKINGRVVGNKK